MPQSKDKNRDEFILRTAPQRKDKNRKEFLPKNSATE